MPRQPDPKSGRIYVSDAYHGLQVYLTKTEISRLNLYEVLLFFLDPILITIAVAMNHKYNLFLNRKI